MPKWIGFLLSGILVFGLVLVRVFEEDLFYDPFLKFFQQDYLNKPLPDYQLGWIGVNVTFRYLLNSLIGLGIIWFLFRDIKKVKFSGFVFLIFWLLLLPAYLYMIEIDFKFGENIGFYIRRFLIQPMLPLVMVPAFYYFDYMKRLNKIDSGKN